MRDVLQDLERRCSLPKLSVFLLLLFQVLCFVNFYDSLSPSVIYAGVLMSVIIFTWKAELKTFPAIVFILVLNLLHFTIIHRSYYPRELHIVSTALLIQLNLFVLFLRFKFSKLSHSIAILVMLLSVVTAYYNLLDSSSETEDSVVYSLVYPQFALILFGLFSLHGSRNNDVILQNQKKRTSAISLVYRLVFFVLILSISFAFLRPLSRSTARFAASFAYKHLFFKSSHDSGFANEPLDKRQDLVTGVAGGDLMLPSQFELKNDYTTDLLVKFESNIKKRNAIYLKTSSYTEFKGDRWSESRKRYQFDRVSDRESLMAYTLSIQSETLNQLPYVETWRTLNGRAVKSSDYSINPSQVGVAKKFRLESDFKDWTTVPKEVFNSLEDFPSPYEEIPFKVRSLAQAISQDKASIHEKIVSIWQYLQGQYDYSLIVENPQRRSAVDNFLFHEKKGHCSLFASSFVLMLRSLNIPANVVGGYASSEFDADDNIFVVRRAHAHAWVEIIVPNYGLITIDPTPVSERNELLESEAKSILVWLKSFFMNLTVERGFSLFVFILFLAVFIFFVRKKKSHSRDFIFIEVFLKKYQSYALRGHSEPLRTYLQRLKQMGFCDHSLDSLIDYYYSVKYAEKERNLKLEKEFIKLVKKQKLTKNGIR